jgi:chromosome segregation ATPase
MDGTATMTEIRQTFGTPVRILLPKLLKSRNDWKAKSHQRKAELKSAKIKIRDVSASRARWRQRTEQLQEGNQQLQEENQQLQNRLACVERERNEARAALANAQKK